ncbi:MAG: hypothetical protein WD770_09940 [Actinomycetota bacterium]
MPLFGKRVAKTVDAALRGKSSNARAQAGLELSTLDDPNVVPMLMRGLADPETAEEAAEVLINRALRGRSDVGLPELRAVLQNDRSGGLALLVAAHRVLPFGDPAADRLAVAVLAQKSVEAEGGQQRSQAIEAMAGMGGQRLRAALQGVPPNEGTLAALATLGDADAKEQLERRTQEAAAKRAEADRARAASAPASPSASVPELIAQFTSHDPGRILQAGQALAAHGAPVVEPLLEAIGDAGMLARYRQTSPWSEDDAKLLIMELTGQRMRMAEGDRPLT